eukprot:06590.XXX_251936_252259_1 [CDS] Oithona nana genome sequencing.
MAIIFSTNYFIMKLIDVSLSYKSRWSWICSQVDFSRHIKMRFDMYIVKLQRCDGTNPLLIFVLILESPNKGVWRNAQANANNPINCVHVSLDPSLNFFFSHYFNYLG